MIGWWSWFDATMPVPTPVFCWGFCKPYSRFDCKSSFLMLKTTSFSARVNLGRTHLWTVMDKQSTHDSPADQLAAAFSDVTRLRGSRASRWATLCVRRVPRQKLRTSNPLMVRAPVACRHVDAHKHKYNELRTDICHSRISGG